jgi:hypothetical protein
MAKQIVTAESAYVLQALTDPAACGRWAPVAFTTDQPPGERLQAGTRTSLRGRIAGRTVTFEIHVVAADERGLSLRATGPVNIDVDYRFTPAARATLIEAQIALAQTGGIAGALIARATDAMLGAGALRFALRTIAAEAEQLQLTARTKLVRSPRTESRRLVVVNG